MPFVPIDARRIWSWVCGFVADIRIACAVEYRKVTLIDKSPDWVTRI